MGGVVAAAYACGIPILEIEKFALRLKNLRELMKLVDLSPQRRGLMEGNHVRNYLTGFFLDRTFESLKIPLALPAVDLIQAREIVFKEGLVLPAVMATIAVPGLFAPAAIGPYRLIDGGVMNNLPVDCARDLGASRVIAVDVQLDPYHEKPWQDQETPPHFPIPLPGFFLDFYRAELIMIAEITRRRLKESCPELLLHPNIPPDITMFLGFQRVDEIIKAGEQCARQALPAIREMAFSANDEYPSA
jgi:NTE family protein